jgi:hypothetical protein
MMEKKATEGRAALLAVYSTKYWPWAKVQSQ